MQYDLDQPAKLKNCEYKSFRRRHISVFATFNASIVLRKLMVHARLRRNQMTNLKYRTINRLE